MVTAETAVVLPVIVVVLAAAVWLLACVAAQLKCVDAAATAARLAARGESVSGAVSRIAPASARVRVLRRGDEVEVSVVAVVRPFGTLLRLPGLTVSGRAVALIEPAR